MIDSVDELAPPTRGRFAGLITFVKDRPGHDRRYAIDAAKIERQLGWRNHHWFERGIRETVAWYLSNQPWIAQVKAAKTA